MKKRVINFIFSCFKIHFYFCILCGNYISFYCCISSIFYIIYLFVSIIKKFSSICSHTFPSYVLSLHSCTSP